MASTQKTLMFDSPFFVATSDIGKLLPIVMILTKAFMLGSIASSLAIIYSEILYSGLKAIYTYGKLKRYYPLPTNRHILTAWSNAMAFTCPVALFAITCQKDMQRTRNFSPVAVLMYTFLYMIIHDIYFYMIHSTFHFKRFLYDYFHAMHHEYVYAMNVYCVGYAEIAENFLQVGVPWVLWTWIAGDNWFNWILPLSLVPFTTLVGHSGYRMSRLIAIFHPLIIPVVALTGKHMLTPGDHQVHHTHRRYNYGLFWKGMDKYFGTYRKCEVRAYDIAFWKKWHEAQQSESEQGKKWLGRHNTQFSEVEWGF
ncbi:hypothetical protein E8E13_009973 [Curvularia kusanoi]|uniref:Fatty acid hydroxylase domain-containing protein n=1 Tax=Curvularia kusanoi TaxID=90978 RepID=A0A9P4TF72_CURKU|nr:hypothetical protein E8E13_009973 [Curvularia kusanoi]